MASLSPTFPRPNGNRKREKSAEPNEGFLATLSFLFFFFNLGCGGEGLHNRGKVCVGGDPQVGIPVAVHKVVVDGGRVAVGAAGLGERHGHGDAVGAVGVEEAAAAVLARPVGASRALCCYLPVRVVGLGAGLEDRVGGIAVRLGRGVAAAQCVSHRKRKWRIYIYIYIKETHLAQRTDPVAALAPLVAR